MFQIEMTMNDYPMNPETPAVAHKHVLLANPEDGGVYETITATVGQPKKFSRPIQVGEFWKVRTYAVDELGRESEGFTETVVDVTKPLPNTPPEGSSNAVLVPIA